MCDGELRTTRLTRPRSARRSPVPICVRSDQEHREPRLPDASSCERSAGSRTMAACAIRAPFAELGIIVGQGRQRVDCLVALLDDEELTLPANARMALPGFVTQLKKLDQQVEAIERELAELRRTPPMAKLLSSIPGIGPITATAIAATVPVQPCCAQGGSLRPGLA